MAIEDVVRACEGGRHGWGAASGVEESGRTVIACWRRDLRLAATLDMAVVPWA